MDVGLPTPSSSQRVSMAKPSLYRTSMETLEKLYRIPELEWALFPDGIEQVRRAARQSLMPVDPVGILWECFRRGTPLCQLFNVLGRPTQLPVGDLGSVGSGGARGPAHQAKAAVYHFLKACKEELLMSDSELFTITELFRDDTSGFVRVLHSVNIVLARIEAEAEGALVSPGERKLSIGSLASPIDAAPGDHVGQVLTELLATEQTYVEALETLHGYRDALAREERVSRDVLFCIFVNLNDLVDFQRRFLLALEGLLRAPPAERRVGQLFISSEKGFDQYNIFCSNYKRAMAVVTAHAGALVAAPIADPVRQLSSLLIKPTQRICKYPLLLRELGRYADPATSPHCEELRVARTVMERVAETVNEATRQEENREVVRDLLARVDDWKGLNPAKFGELVVHDTFLMCSSENVEREYLVFLFQRVLLCCKEAGKRRGRHASAANGAIAGGMLGSAPATPLVIKGNIFMSAMTSVLPCEKLTLPATPVGLKVFWRDGQDLESFTLKCRNDEQVRLWISRIERLIESERLRRKNCMSAQISSLIRTSQLASAYPGELPVEVPAQAPPAPPASWGRAQNMVLLPTAPLAAPPAPSRPAATLPAPIESHMEPATPLTERASVAWSTSGSSPTLRPPSVSSFAGVRPLRPAHPFLHVHTGSFSSGHSVGALAPHPASPSNMSLPTASTLAQPPQPPPSPPLKWPKRTVSRSQSLFVDDAGGFASALAAAGSSPPLPEGVVPGGADLASMGPPPSDEESEYDDLLAAYAGPPASVAPLLVSGTAGGL